MAAAEDYRTRISQVSYRNQAFINGKFAAAQSGMTFDCISPIDGQVLTKVASCDKEDVEHAVKAARAVFEKGAWSQMAPVQRKRILLRWVSLIEKHAHELALLETLDVGKPITHSQAVDLGSTIKCLQWRRRGPIPSR